MVYTILTTSDYIRKAKRITKRNNYLLGRYKEVTDKLARNPFDPSLSTHKINNPIYGKVFSSSVNGDIRILWEYDDEKEVVILLLTTGRHSGGMNVYRSL